MTADLLTGHCLDLKKAYQRNLALGFAISATLHLAAVSAVLLITAMGSRDKIAPPVIDISSITQIIRPPTISHQPDQDLIKTLERNVPIVTGNIEAVPDEEAPEEIEIATQDQLANLAPTLPVEDLGDVGVNIDFESIEKELLPSPKDFVPFEDSPVPVKTADPLYPDLARRAGLEADIWVKVLIDTEGRVRDVLIAKPTERLRDFENAAIDAAYKGVWKPAVANGQPVAVWITYKVSFRLR